MKKIKIQFILILRDGTEVTNTKMYSDDDETWDTEGGVGCVMEFEGIPMIQDYNIMANKIAGPKQFEFDGNIVRFNTKLID